MKGALVRTQRHADPWRTQFADHETARPIRLRGQLHPLLLQAAAAAHTGDAAKFVFPLPPRLSLVNAPRRLTITLAWLSPVHCARQAYRVAHLWFDPRNELAPKRQFADHRAAQRGTVQHEVLEGNQVRVFQDGGTLAIKVNCRADAGDISHPIRYGLTVTLEVIERAETRLFLIPIYQEVRERLAIRVPVRGASI